MGSTVSVAVANLIMEDIETEALNKTKNLPRTHRRFVDDIFNIIDENQIDQFHHTLNSIHPSIQFTLEKLNNNI